MEYIITFIVAFWLGSKLTSIWNRIVYRDLLRDLGVTEKQLRQTASDYGFKLDDEEDPKIPTLTDLEIKLEQHHGIIYAFRLDNDQFLGQGKNREELIDSLKKNLTDVRVIIAEEHGAKLVQP